MHAHRCNNCSTEWRHSEQYVRDRDAHTCPTCGTVSFARVPMDQLELPAGPLKKLRILRSEKRVIVECEGDRRYVCQSASWSGESRIEWPEGSPVAFCETREAIVLRNLKS